jgi:hypothetical protein
MKAIETTAVVGDDRRLTVQLPLDVAPGPHQIVVVVDAPGNELQGIVNDSFDFSGLLRPIFDLKAWHLFEVLSISRDDHRILFPGDGGDA